VDGDATCIIESKVTLAVASVGLIAKLITRKWEGRMCLTIPPYPMARVAIGFVAPPRTQMDIDVQIQTQKSSSIPTQLKKFLENKLKEVIHETFVEPNAEWLVLPGVPENEPPPPKTSTHITSPYLPDDHENQPTQLEKKLKKVVDHSTIRKVMSLPSSPSATEAPAFGLGGITVVSAAAVMTKTYSLASTVQQMEEKLDSKNSKTEKDKKGKKEKKTKLKKDDKKNGKSNSADKKTDLKKNQRSKNQSRKKKIFREASKDDSAILYRRSQTEERPKKDKSSMSLTTATPLGVETEEEARSDDSHVSV